jgi:hypothetical protein
VQGHHARRWATSRLCFLPDGKALSFVAWDRDRTLQRMAGVMREFLDDSRAVLARSRDSCAICGRPLTDGLSMARGIGPECIRWAGALWFVVEGAGPIQPEPAADSKARA